MREDNLDVMYGNFLSIYSIHKIFYFYTLSEYAHTANYYTTMH